MGRMAQQALPPQGSVTYDGDANASAAEVQEVLLNMDHMQTAERLPNPPSVVGRHHNEA